MEGLGENKLLKKIVSRTLLTLLLIILVTLACSGGEVEEGYLREIKIDDLHSLWILNVKGIPYDMGYQNGSLLKDSIQKEIQYRIQEVINMGYNYTYLFECAKTMEPHIPLEYIKEMEGLAAGANMDYNDVLVYHVIADTLFYDPGWTGCSGFAVFGNATVDGHLYHGRSFDSPFPVTNNESIGLITVYEPENGNAFVNVGWFGFVGVLTGMNKEGITLQQNSVGTDDKTLDGMPISFMLREVLQYSNNLTEAIDIICQTDRTVGWNIILGDGKNLNAAAVEISDNYCQVYWAGDPTEDIGPYYSIPNAVRRTNSYVNPEYGCNRYETLSQLILDNYGNITAEMSIEFLRTFRVAVPKNQQSVVFDATNLELWVADASFGTPAYNNTFVYLSYDDWFAE